jgi:exodeoxyribonuclease-3
MAARGAARTSSRCRKPSSTTSASRFGLAALGYRSVFCGQKTYNGVALLSRVPFSSECITAIPNFDDPQKRVLAGHRRRPAHRGPVRGERRERGQREVRVQAALARRPCANGCARNCIAHPNLIVLGDFNIAPDDRDVHDPKRWREKILCSTPEREA